MKVKIVEPGWEGFSGQMGEVEFVDGVSVEALSKIQIGRIGAALRLENVEDGLQQSAAADLIRYAEMNADEAMALEENADEAGAQAKLPRGEAGKRYTAESLGEIADKEGINGLREIGDRYGVKSRKVSDLIKLILAAQDSKAEAPAAAEPVADEAGLAALAAIMTEPAAEPAAADAEVEALVADLVATEAKGE